jgi:hypothetical protein
MLYDLKCKECGREFIGRKNQQFHDLDCKIIFNNRLAENLNLELVDNKILKKNHILLKEIHLVYENKPVLLAYLQRRGLDLTAPTRKWKTKKYGFDVYVANGFGYIIKTEDGRKLISVYKEAELDKL